MKFLSNPIINVVGVDTTSQKMRYYVLRVNPSGW